MNAGPVNELEIESSVLALWEEFLSGYFDGNRHSVGANAAIKFPKASLRFQQAAQQQPMHGVGISLVWVQRPKVRKYWAPPASGPTRKADGSENVQQQAEATVEWLFWIRASKPTDNDGNAKDLATQTADLLHGLLENSGATLPLSENGIHKLRPSPPQLVSEGAYELRIVQCAALLRWTVMSQG